MIGTGTGILYQRMSIIPFAQLFVEPSLSLCLSPLSLSPLSARSPQRTDRSRYSDLIGLLCACGRRRRGEATTTQPHPNRPASRGFTVTQPSRQARSVFHQVFTVAGRSAALRLDPLFSRRCEQFARMCALEGDDHALSATTGSFHHGAEGRQRPCRLQGIVY